LSCASRWPDRLILGSDTLIELDGEVLGKPADLEEARRMLERLAGREHLIHTAVALRRQTNGCCETAVETVRVRMAAFTVGERDAYLRTGESLGKAGAYSIQGEGSRFITRIEGDYTAAVGLPLRRTAALLAACGCPVPVDLGDLYRRKPYPNWARYE
jgi:septum formation protein